MPYKPIEVRVARGLADTFKKDLIVIASYDREHERTNITTYGRTAADKALAAEVGDVLAADLQLAQTRTYEDFRRNDPAKAAELIENLEIHCRSAAFAFQSLQAVRDGIPDDRLAELAEKLWQAVKACESWRSTGGDSPET